MPALRLLRLASFIKILRDSGVLPSLNINRFDHRLRLQKYVFLSKKFGISGFNSYLFSEYMYGPYSPGLADDYYEMERNRMDPYTEFDKRFYEELNRSAEFKKFVNLVRNKDSKWLEVAATMLDLSEAVKRDVSRGIIQEENAIAVLKDMVKNRKPFASKRFIEEIYSELKHAGIVAI